MAFLSQIKFAELAGASDRTIKDAIADGKLVKDSKTKGLDPSHPKNKAWLEEWGRKEIKRGPKQKTPTEPKNDLPIRMETYGSLEDQKLEQEIKLKKEQTLAIQQKRLASMGTLILRDLVEKRIAKLGQSLKTHVLSVPRRSSARIVSLVKSGASVSEIEKELATELEKALHMGKR